MDISRIIDPRPRDIGREYVLKIANRQKIGTVILTGRKETQVTITCEQLELEVRTSAPEHHFV